MERIRILSGRFHICLPTELEDLQSHYAELQEMGVEVFSVSVDSEFVHKAWLMRLQTSQKFSTLC